MAQVDTFDAFNQRNTEFLEKFVLTPIVIYVQTKGCNVTIEDLRTVLKLSKVTVASFDAALPPVGGLPTSIPAPRVTQTKKQTATRTPTGERCAHILKKSKDRSGEPCGKAAYHWSRCKGCLAKKSVQEELATSGIATQAEIEAVIKDSKKKDSSVTSVAPPDASLAQGTRPIGAMPMGIAQNDFIELDRAAGLFLHNPSRLIVQAIPDGYNAVGILPQDRTDAEHITPDKHPLIIKYNFLFEGKRLAPVYSAPPQVLQAPQAPQVLQSLQTLQSPQVPAPAILSVPPAPSPIYPPQTFSAPPAPAPISSVPSSFTPQTFSVPPASSPVPSAPSNPTPMMLPQPQPVYAPTANGTMVMPPSISPPGMHGLMPPPMIPGLVQPMILGQN